MASNGRLRPWRTSEYIQTAAAVVFVPQAALAPDSWKSGVSGKWSNAALWSTGKVPGAGSSVGISVAGTYTVSVTSAASAGAVTIDDGGATLSIGADLKLGGTLAVTAGTLSLGQGGTLTGGTLLADAGGALILDNGGTLDGVSVQGTLTLAKAGGLLSLGQGLAAGNAATIVVKGANETLNFADTATLNGTSITLDPVQYQSFINLVDTSTTAQTFTIGATSTISVIAGDAFLDVDLFAENPANLTIANDGRLSASGSTADFGIGSQAGAFVNTGLISVTGGAALLLESTIVTNAGTIAVSGAGSTLFYDYGGEIPGSSWANTGKIDVSAGGTVLLYGTGGLAGLLGISDQGGTVNIEGTVTGPGTLPLPAYSPGSLLLSGTLSGATIFDPNGTSAFYQDGADLTNDSYRGTLTIDNVEMSISNVAFAGAAGTGIGAIVMEGDGPTLNVYGNLDNAVLSMGGGANLNFAFGATSPETLTLGPHFEILDTGGANINNDSGGCTLDNEGTILAGDSSGRITIFEQDGPGSSETDFLVNSGKIEATNGDRLEVWGENYGDSLTNSGLISASGGATLSMVQNTVTTTGTVTATGKGTTLTFGTQPTNLGTVAASWTNRGMIGASNGATMDLMGGVRNAGNIGESGGTLNFISNVVSSGTISASGGSIAFGGELGGTGVLDIGAGASVLLPGTAEGYFDFQAGGGVLETSHGNLLYGMISGFAAQDSIDLLKTAANGLSYSGGILTVTEAGTAIAHLHFAGSYSSASFTLTPDGQSGTSIHFV